MSRRSGSVPGTAFFFPYGLCTTASVYQLFRASTMVKDGASPPTWYRNTYFQEQSDLQHLYGVPTRRFKPQLSRKPERQAPAHRRLARRTWTTAASSAASAQIPSWWPTSASAREAPCTPPR